MRKLNIQLFSYLLLLFLLANGCKKDRTVDEEEREMNNTGIALNSEIMGLGSFFGDVFSDVVLVNAQDGPVTQLMTAELKDLLELTEEDDGFFIFNVHQVQTLNPQDFNTEISFEKAKTVDQESIDMLAKVIRFFKDQDKKVYVLGISFGAFMTQELINREGPDIADKYLIMTGRLDIPDLIWQAFSEGNTGGFIDGTTPFTGMLSTLSDAEKNGNKLIAGLSFKRYTEELSKYNDLTKVTFCFGTLDETVGALTQNERALLITRQANILQLETGHRGTIEGLIKEGFKVAFSD